MEQEAMITTENLSRAFPVQGEEPFYALKDVSITIPTGRLTILRGTSGSGKTTLVNLIGALDEPTTGSVTCNGRKLSELSRKEIEHLRRTEMGFVFQSVSLIPNMTVYENVEFALRLGNYSGDYKSRVMECLDLVGLSARKDHMPQELSGGEQQRVAIARAIAHFPKVIFADEPTAELDSATSRSVIKTFKELVESQGITIVMTTHDMSLMNEGDRIITLEDGHVVDVKENKPKAGSNAAENDKSEAGSDAVENDNNAEAGSNATENDNAETVSDVAENDNAETVSDAAENDNAEAGSDAVEKDNAEAISDVANAEKEADADE